MNELIEKLKAVKKLQTEIYDQNFNGRVAESGCSNDHLRLYILINYWIENAELQELFPNSGEFLHFIEHGYFMSRVAINQGQFGLLSSSWEMIKNNKKNESK